MTHDHTIKRPTWQLILLGCGIYVAPYVFAWFTLRPGYPRWLKILSFSYAGLVLIVVATFIFFGGDRWPVSVDNRTKGKIEVIYKHSDFNQWSAPFDVAPDKAITLAKFHFMKDIQGLKIAERGEEYEIAPGSLAQIRGICAGEVNCNLTYWGRGKIQASLTPTRELNFSD